MRKEFVRANRVRYCAQPRPIGRENVFMANERRE